MDTQETVAVATLPRRPRGMHAQKNFSNTEIITNFYRVETGDFSQIHIFKVRFNPAIPFDDPNLRNRLFQMSLSDIKKNIKNPILSGFNIFSTSSPIQKEFIVTAEDRQIMIKEVKVLNINENKNILVHFLNNGLRNIMNKLQYVEIGRTKKFFNIKKNQKIDNLMMFSGFQANFMQLQRGIYLRVDTAKKIVRNQTVLQFINQLYRSNQSASKDEKRQILKQQLINKIIMTNYGKTRYVKVQDVQFIDMETTIIPDVNLPIKEYFTTKYKIKIQNVRQPLLVIEEKRDKIGKTYMVPQLCLMTGIPDDFDEFRRKKISQATIKPAEQRMRQIGMLMSQLKNTNEVGSLRELGIKIDQNMERFNAKMIRAPILRLGKDYKVESGKQSFFQLFSQPIYQAKHSLKLGIIAFRSADLGQLLNTFQSTSKNLNVDLKCTKVSAGDFDFRKALQVIDDCLYRVAEKEGCNICLIVIPNQLKTQYKKIKQMSLFNNKIVCQVATEATLKKNGFRSIATKILLQLIAKRGNTLWVPESSLKLQKVMLSAFDVGKCGSTNILAGVASMNSTFSSVFSKIDQYTDINSKMGKMANVLLQLVDAYYKRNSYAPKDIIVFTNSCSNDQISLYQQFMIQPVLDKLNELYSVEKPNVTMIMVNTKTSQRFFQGQGSSVRNVPAGTIVSENIVSNNYDFFMMSQFATRGSTVPNHYKVIFNDSKMQQGVLQQLIYSQCFNYVNWTGSIKVPGILQYAKKCLKFNTEVLEMKKLSDQLESKLYFI